MSDNALAAVRFICGSAVSITIIVAAALEHRRRH